jgi:hypothetical protein
VGHTAVDLTGRQFGKLVVIARAENDRWQHARWLCRCSYGTEKVVPAANLRRSNSPTRSCGCLQREIIDLTGQRFGRLVALDFELRDYPTRSVRTSSAPTGGASATAVGSVTLPRRTSGRETPPRASARPLSPTTRGEARDRVQVPSNGPESRPSHGPGRRLARRPSPAALPLLRRGAVQRQQASQPR